MTPQERIAYITNGLKWYGEKRQYLDCLVARQSMMLHTHLEFVERKLGKNK